MADKYYTIKFGGLERRLPIFEAAPGIQIAVLNILGDTELVQKAAHLLAKKLPKTGQIILTPEVKSIPLAYELSIVMKIPYIVARKILKPYMTGAIKSKVVSITTGKPQTIYLDGRDLQKIKGKNVVLLDDVISTGSTLEGLMKLVKKAQGKIVAEAAIFTEGDPNKWDRIISLGNLPVWLDKKKSKAGGL